MTAGVILGEAAVTAGGQLPGHNNSVAQEPGFGTGARHAREEAARAVEAAKGPEAPCGCCSGECAGLAAPSAQQQASGAAQQLSVESSFKSEKAAACDESIAPALAAAERAELLYLRRRDRAEIARRSRAHLPLASAHTLRAHFRYTSVHRLAHLELLIARRVSDLESILRTVRVAVNQPLDSADEH